MMMMMARVILRSVARRGSSIVPRRNFSSSASTTNELKEFVAYAKRNRIVSFMAAGACYYTVPECIRLFGEELRKRKSVEELTGKSVEEVEKKKSGLYQAKTQVPRETVTVAV